MGQEQQALALADLAADGTTLTPEEAVALTLAVAERLGWSEPPNRPELIVIRGDGTVHLPRAANAAPATPAQYADLLHALLAFGRGEAGLRVPGPLLLLIARARGEIDLPAFASADEFRQALVRFLSRPAITRHLGCHGTVAPGAGGSRRLRRARRNAARRDRASTNCGACCARRTSNASRWPNVCEQQAIRCGRASHRPARAPPTLRPSRPLACLSPDPGNAGSRSSRAHLTSRRPRACPRLPTHSARETRASGGAADAPSTRQPARSRGSVAAGVAALLIPAGGLFWASRDSGPVPPGDDDGVAVEAPANAKRRGPAVAPRLRAPEGGSIAADSRDAPDVRVAERPAAVRPATCSESPGRQRAPRCNAAAPDLAQESPPDDGAPSEPAAAPSMEHPAERRAAMSSACTRCRSRPRPRTRLRSARTGRASTSTRRVAPAAG